MEVCESNRHTEYLGYNVYGWYGSTVCLRHKLAVSQSAQSAG